MDIGKHIEKLREERGIQQKTLALALGVGQATVSNWESGRQEPNPAQRKKLCAYFKVSDAELYGGLKPIEIKDAAIPIVSAVGATDNLGKTYFSPFEPPYKTISFKDCKAVVVDSNSMAPIAYKGQKIIYCETEPVANGDLVFVKFKDGSQIFKRYFKNHKNKSMTLQSINPTESYEPIIKEDIEVEFMYKVVGVKF